MTAAFIYDATGHDREVELDAGLGMRLRRTSLLWIDMERSDETAAEAITARLKLDPRSMQLVQDADGPARLHNFGDYYQLRVVTPPSRGADDGKPLDFIVGKDWLVTAHDSEIEFLQAFREQGKAETQIGAMSSPALAASLLDWHLGSYFDALARIEGAVDKLDEQTLAQAGGRSHLGRMLALRRQVARLRALLSSQRGVFYGLARPDFTLVADNDAAKHLRTLAGRFERAIDEVERGRDLVASSFDLFSSRTAEQTNELVKILTFVTVITGVFAAVAGLMGMNFEASLFKTGNTGFYVVTIGLLLGAFLSGVVARLRGWL